MENSASHSLPPLPYWPPAVNNPAISTLPPLQPLTPAMDTSFTLPLPPLPSLVPSGHVLRQSGVCTDLLFGYFTGDKIPGSTSTLPRTGVSSVPKGGSSEGFLAHENTTSYWPREDDISLPEVPSYGYGYTSWMQPPPLYYAANPYNMSNTSIHVNNGTIPCSISGTSFDLGNPVRHCKLYSASGLIKNATTPCNIYEASRSVESSTEPSNILGTSTLDPRAVVNPEPSSQLSDSVLGKNSGFTFSSKLPHENGVFDNTFHCESGTVLPVPRSSHNRIHFYQSDMKSTETPCGIGRVQSYPHKGTHTDILKEENFEVRNDRKGEMEAKVNQRASLELFERVRKHNLSMKRNAVQHISSCSPASGACVPSDTVEAIGSSSLVAKGASLNVILEELYNLSDTLSSDFDASELKDHDCELLQLVIDNLGAFTIKNRKNASGRILDDFCQYPEDAHSSTSGLKSNFVINLKSGFHDTEEEVHFFALDTSNDELNSADNPNSPNLNNGKKVAQAAEKIFHDFSNNEESSEAMVYKKLWIDAEAALCSLKYDLQLAQMKLEAQNHNHQSIGELQQSSDVSTLNSMRAHDAYGTLVIAKENNPLATLPGSKDKVAASMMARLKVLKDRDTLNSTGTFQQSSQVSSLSSMSDLYEPETPHITKEKNSLEALPTDEGTGVTSVVMARLKVLKDRDDTPNTTSADQQSKLANLSGTGDDTFCFQESEINSQSCQFFHEPEINTSTRKNDDELRQGLDASSTDTAQPTSGGEGSNLSSEWEHVTRFELL